MPVATIIIALFDSPRSPERDGPITNAGFITANSKGLVESGAANMITENELTPLVLADYITKVLSSDKLASKMAKAAVSRSKPNALAEFADMIEVISKNGS